MDQPKTAADYNALARKQFEAQPDQALETAVKALVLANEEGDKQQQAEALRHVGSAYWAFSEYDMALKHYFESLRLCESIGYLSGIAGVHNNLALVYNKLGHLDDAQKHLEMARDAYVQYGEPIPLAAVNNNLGKLYERKEMFDEAIRCHKETLRITQQLNHKPGILRAKINIGVVRSQMDDYDGAETCYAEAYKLCEELEFNREIIFLLSNRVSNFSHAGDWDRAEKFLHVMQQKVHEIDTKDGRLALLDTEAKYYRMRGEYNKTVGETEQALEDFSEACYAMLDSKKLRGSQFNSELSDKIARLHSLFQVEREQHETKIAEQKAEIYRLENVELVKRQKKLEQAMDDIKQLQGLIPICSHCKKIRDDSGFWRQVEEYISAHSEAKFTHSLCPHCLEELYPDVHEQLIESGEIDLSDKEKE